MNVIQLYKKSRDAIIAVLLVLGYHWYDEVCFAISNLFSYVSAIIIMTLFLFSLSAVFVYFHELLSKKFSWDVLQLSHLNELKEIKSIPRHQIFKRLIQYILIKGYWYIYFIGPATIGPFIVAILLRKENTLKQNLFYIIPGTMISVIFWVSIWKGTGMIIWHK